MVDGVRPLLSKQVHSVTISDQLFRSEGPNNRLPFVLLGPRRHFSSVPNITTNQILRTPPAAAVSLDSVELEDEALALEETEEEGFTLDSF